MFDFKQQKLLEPSSLNGEQLLRNETMKRNQVTLAVLLAALSFVAAPSASAISTTQVQAIKRVVADVSPAEIAARAANLVSQAPKADRKDVAVTTVREVVSKRPATIVAVVAAIAKVAPEISAKVAGEAATLATDQAAAIAKAAASSAPAQADQIALAVAKAVPSSAAKVARAVALVVPDQTVAVSETISKAMPSVASEIASDSTIQRLSQRSASGPGVSGLITTYGGTISGHAIPNVPPTAETAAAGFDNQRLYGSPR
jgi:hypothetical protein